MIGNPQSLNLGQEYRKEVMGDPAAPSTGEREDDEVVAMDGSYYAKDGKVWKAPEETERENGKRSFTFGFPVCTMSEYAGAEAAETVAAMMNAAVHHETLVAALEELVRASDGHHGSFRQRDAARAALRALTPQPPTEEK